MTERTNYDAISGEFARMSEVDPNKRDAQYYTAKKLLGDVSGKSILEIGTGAGPLARDLAKSGGLVTAFDASAEQIRRAKEKEEQESLGIKYFQADATKFVSQSKFDYAVSSLVFQHAKNTEELKKFFSTALHSLKPGGKLVGIVTNSDLKRFGQKIYNRTYVRTQEGIKVIFDNPVTGERFEVLDTAFKKEDYESAAQVGGFGKFEWKPMQIDPKSKQELGDFWQGWEEDPPYLAFVAERSNND